MDDKKEYEKLYQLKKQYGFTVPIMKDYEQYGLEYTDAKRGKLKANKVYVLRRIPNWRGMVFLFLPGFVQVPISRPFNYAPPSPEILF